MEEEEGTEEVEREARGIRDEERTKKNVSRTRRVFGASVALIVVVGI